MNVRQTEGKNREKREKNVLQSFACQKKEQRWWKTWDDLCTFRFKYGKKFYVSIKVTELLYLLSDFETKLVCYDSVYDGYR